MHCGSAAGFAAGLISISFPFRGVILGVFGVFRGLASRRGNERETQEILDSSGGGPNGRRFPAEARSLTCWFPYRRLTCAMAAT
jgi:hypothetical protein